MSIVRVAIVLLVISLPSRIAAADNPLLGEATANVFVRDAPNGAKIDSLTARTALGLIGYRNGWVQVLYFAPNGQGKHGWVSAKYVRITNGSVASRRHRAPGVSGDDCESEFDTGAQVCVTVADVSLDCSESFAGKYYDSCEVSLEYDVQADYEGDGFLSVDVECEVEISYTGRQMYMRGSDSGSEDENHSLFAFGSDSNTMTFDFSFMSFNEVSGAQIESASCEISSILLL